VAVSRRAAHHTFCSLRKPADPVSLSIGDPLFRHARDGAIEHPHTEPTMRYTLFLHYPEMSAADLGEEMLAAGKAAFHAYARSLEEAGVLRSAEVLQPSTSSTTLTMTDGTPQVQDGPYAETREQIGGSFVIEVPDLDAALGWAERCPAAHWGTIEIRPSAVRFVDGRWIEAA
jgi:hypothetical protein